MTPTRDTAGVRVGVIGAGAIAPTHCEGILLHEDATILAIADTHEGRAVVLQQRYNIRKRYTSAADLLADPEIDAVSIALPTFLHAPVAIAALNAGKHVLLDKPFAMNSTEAAEIASAAASAGVVFTVAMNQRFRAEAQTVKALIERGEIGEIYHAEAYWCRRSGIPAFGTWFGDKTRSGGGTLLDIGVHVLDLCLYLLGDFDIASVTGATYSKFGNRGLGEGGWGASDPGERVFDVDDLASAFIKLKSGTSILLNASWARHQPTTSVMGVDLYGTEGGITTYPPQVSRNGKRDGEYEVVDVALPLRYPMKNRAHNWIEAILGREEVVSTLPENLAVQRVIDAIYESSVSGHEVIV